MDISGKTVVITGGASGIGAALSRQMAEGCARLVIADLAVEAAQALVDEIGGLAVQCDVTRESDIQRVVAEAETKFGPVDIFVSNAGFARGQPGNAASASDEDWQLNWDVHVMSHVYAARAVLPSMIARGDGYLVQMASAAGLLNQIADAAYSATKHAAVSFAESLFITHREDGVKVSVICPQYVATPIIGLTSADADEQRSLLSPEQAASTIIQGIADERFLILTHPQVKEYVQLRAADHEKYLGGMRALRAKAVDKHGQLRPDVFYKLV